MAHAFHSRGVNHATARTIIAADASKSIPERHSAVTVTTGIFRSRTTTVKRSITESLKGNKANDIIYLSLKNGTEQKDTLFSAKG